jgi:hypothetical protein
MKSSPTGSAFMATIMVSESLAMAAPEKKAQTNETIIKTKTDFFIKLSFSF